MAQVYTFTDSNGEVRLMAEINPAPGGGPADGTYIPTAHSTGVTVDTSTFDDPTGAAGKIATLVFPSEVAAIGFAQTGDTVVRVALGSEQDDGLMLGPGNGPVDCFVARGTGGRLNLASANAGSLAIGVADTNHGTLTTTSSPLYAVGGSLQFGAGAPTVGGDVGDLYIRTNSPAPCIYRCTTAGIAGAAVWAPLVVAGSPVGIVTSGALSTVQLVTATGAQILTTRDAETITPCTFNPGVATTATVTAALSPDNVTYSTLGVETEPAGTAFDGTIHLVKVRVPAGWYLKLTVNAQAVLGLTTYY